MVGGGLPRPTLQAILAEAENEGGGNRTHDLEIKSLLLYQLSYALDRPKRGPPARENQGLTGGNNDVPPRAVTERARAVSWRNAGAGYTKAGRRPLADRVGEWAVHLGRSAGALAG